MSEATQRPLELSPEQQARLRGVLGGYYGYTDEWVDEVIQRMMHCHPYDDACGGRGGPCRNHGGAVRCGEDAAPKWVDLFGIDPDYTDGKPVDEWLEEGRGKV